MIRGDIDRLCAAGVPLGRITVGADCMTVVERLRAGERLEVCSLGDVCTSVSGLLRVLYAVASRGASLRSQSDPWLDMEAKGCNWMDLIGRLLEFMSRSTSERTKEALRQRKLSGQSVGRPKGIPPERLKRYRAGVMLYRSSGMSVREICAVSGLEVRSFYRYMKSEGIELKRRNEVNGQSETESAPEYAFGLFRSAVSCAVLFVVPVAGLRCYFDRSPMALSQMRNSASSIRLRP